MSEPPPAATLRSTWRQRRPRASGLRDDGPDCSDPGSSTCGGTPARCSEGRSRRRCGQRAHYLYLHAHYIGGRGAFVTWDKAIFASGRRPPSNVWCAGADAARGARLDCVNHAGNAEDSPIRSGRLIRVTTKSRRGAIVLWSLMFLAVVVSLSWLVGHWVRQGHSFNWTLASVFGTASGRRFLRLQLGFSRSRPPKTFGQAPRSRFSRREQEHARQPLILLQEVTMNVGAPATQAVLISGIIFDDLSTCGTGNRRVQIGYIVAPTRRISTA